MVQSAVSGLIGGSVYALLGLCLVITFRMLGVLNFAQAAVGAFAAFVMVRLHGGGMAYLPAIALALASSVVLAAAIGFVGYRWFSEATLEVRAAVTIGALVALLAAGDILFGSQPQPFPAILPTVHVTISGVVIPGATLLALLVCLVLVIGFEILLGRTRVGTQIRALASRPVTAELIGIPVLRLVIASWAIGGMISTIAMLLIAPVQSSQFSDLSLLILPAAAAALVGLLRSLWLTLAGGLLIGVVSGGATYFNSVGQWHSMVPPAIIVVMLIVLQRGQRWDASR